MLNKLRRLADEGGDCSRGSRTCSGCGSWSRFTLERARAGADAERADEPAARGDAGGALRPSPIAAAYRARAELAEEQGDAARALTLWEQAGERDPNDNFVAERLDHLRPHEPDIARKYVATDADIDAAIKAAATVTHLPGSQYALLLDSEAVQVNSDGSSKRYVVKVSTVFTQNGRDELIRAPLSAQGKTRVLTAYVVQPDGEQQQASSIQKTGVRFRKLQMGSTSSCGSSSTRPRWWRCPPSIGIGCCSPVTPRRLNTARSPSLHRRPPALGRRHQRCPQE